MFLAASNNAHRWAGHVLVTLFSLTETQASEIIATWLRTGLLTEVEFRDPDQRKTRTGVRVAGIRTIITGLEEVPAGHSCIFVCNHVSNLDPPVILPALPGRSSVLLKRELMRIPILGTAMRMAKFIPVDRGHRRDAAQASVAAASEALGSGLHIVVFPEGTRSLDGRLSNFKKGPFFLAKQTGAYVIPVAIFHPVSV